MNSLKAQTEQTQRRQIHSASVVMSDHESDAEEQQELDLSKVSTVVCCFVRVLRLNRSLSLSLTFFCSLTLSPNTKPRLKSQTVCFAARPVGVRMHEASTCEFRVGVLSSVIQACKPDAKIAQLCEQGDKLIQEYVIICFGCWFVS